MPVNDLEMAGRLVLSLILGGLIGIEREIHGRPAGFRTHILVAMGSALVMMLSAYAFATPNTLLPQFRFNYDPGRLAAQVVSGIGFLGAGTIMREGATVRGLTTAASLWVVAGIGMAVGAGVYLPAVATTTLVVITLFLLPKLERHLLRSKRETIVLQISDQPGQLGEIASVLGRHGISIRGVDIDQDAEPHTQMELFVDLPPRVNKITLIGDVAAIDGVHQASFKA